MYTTNFSVVMCTHSVFRQSYTYYLGSKVCFALHSLLSIGIPKVDGTRSLLQANFPVTCTEQYALFIVVSLANQQQCLYKHSSTHYIIIAHTLFM